MKKLTFEQVKEQVISVLKEDAMPITKAEIAGIQETKDMDELFHALEVLLDIYDSEWFVLDCLVER